MKKIKPEIKILLKLAVLRKNTCNECEHKINDKGHYVICGVPDCDCKKRINYIHGKCPSSKWNTDIESFIKMLKEKQEEKPKS